MAPSGESSGAGVVWRRAPSVGCGIWATTNGECRGRKLDNGQRCNAHCGAIVQTIVKEMTDFGLKPLPGEMEVILK